MQNTDISGKCDENMKDIIYPNDIGAQIRLRQAGDIGNTHGPDNDKGDTCLHCGMKRIKGPQMCKHLITKH